MHFYTVLFDEVGCVRKTLLHTEVLWLLPGKVLVQLFEFQAELAAFFHRTLFLLDSKNIAEKL